MTSVEERQHLPRSWGTSAERHGSVPIVQAGPVAVPHVSRRETQTKSPPPLLDERKTRALWQALSDMVAVVHRDGFMLNFQAPTDLEYPLSSEKLVGRSLMELLPSAIAQQARYYIEKALRTGAPQSMSAQFKLPGKLRTFQVRLSPCGENEVLAVVRDVTERTQIEKELLEISHREQMRIGQDLHDGLGQHLRRITFLTRALEKKLAAQHLPEAAEVAEVSRLVMQALSQTRSLARGLFPVELESKGLASALRQLAATVEELFGVSCVVDFDASVTIRDQTVATHLFRLTQEAVNNAVRHGKAKRLSIELTRAADYLALAIRDDGVGFPKDGPKTQGLGLKIMQYRAQKVGGVLSLQPGEDGGTVVTCLFAQPAPENPSRDGRTL